MRPLHGKALHQIDDDVAGPIVPWYLVHVLACIYRFRDGTVEFLVPTSIRSCGLGFRWPKSQFNSLSRWMPETNQISPVIIN